MIAASWLAAAGTAAVGAEKEDMLLEAQVMLWILRGQ